MNPQTDISRDRQRKLCDLIASKPEGIEAKDIPLNRRCYLRPLESAARIVYRDGRWYANNYEDDK